MNDGVGIGEGEAGAACLERDEKHLGFAGLEFFNEILSVFARSGKFEVAGLLLDKVFFNDV